MIRIAKGTLENEEFGPEIWLGFEELSSATLPKIFEEVLSVPHLRRMAFWLAH